MVVKVSNIRDVVCISFLFYSAVSWIMDGTQYIENYTNISFVKPQSPVPSDVSKVQWLLFLPRDSIFSFSERSNCVDSI